MKSNKAKDLIILQPTFGEMTSVIYCEQNKAIQAVIIAEQEADERAIKAHRQLCFHLIYNQVTGELNRCIKCYNGDILCDMQCEYMNKFKQLLNE